jgi:pimeloyl-ACP methyl ester carboxylesterase
MCVSHGKATRLIVFVHGFLGDVLRSWTDFELSGQVGQWWEESDLLFVGYRSTRENITSVADRLRRYLPAVYPTPFPAAMNGNGVRARDDISSPYEELLLVGHSLGGLVIRCALVDAAQQWVNGGPGAEKPVLLNAETRLFSPASAGFRPAGLLGLAEELGMLKLTPLRLGMCSAYTDLQPDSTLIADIQKRTEHFVEITSEPALRASILWANPDNVVRTEWYATDKYRESTDWGQTHTTVCKPRDTYRLPWHFVENGVRTP